jgi:hypothetical protein
MFEADDSRKLIRGANWLVNLLISMLTGLKDSVKKLRFLN